MNNGFNSNISPKFNLYGTIDNKSSLAGTITETLLKGLSAYEVAVKNGFDGTEQEWLSSLCVHVEVVSDEEHEYILSITTSDGTFLTPNLKPILIKGVDYLTPEDVQEFESDVATYIFGIAEEMFQRKGDYVVAEEGKSLIADSEIDRLATLHNYDDEGIKSDINGKVDKVPGKSLILDTEIARLKNVDNYNDEQIRYDLNNHISSSSIHVTPSDKNKWDNKSDFDGDYDSLTNTPNIPDEQTVESWGFTKNTGTYTKPENGIPKTDFDSNVQNSLLKADTALQEHQDISGKVDVVPGKSLIADSEITRLADVHNYNDTEIRNIINGKADSTTLSSHVNDSNVHILSNERDTWNDKTKVEVNKAITDETPIATSITLDGITYKIVGGSGGGLVNSVNEKIGDVVLSAADVGALPDTTILPTNLSDLNSDDDHNTVTKTQMDSWDAKSNFDGNYDSLNGKPKVETENIDFNNYFGGDN